MVSFGDKGGRMFQSGACNSTDSRKMQTGQSQGIRQRLQAIISETEKNWWLWAVVSGDGMAK